MPPTGAAPAASLRVRALRACRRWRQLQLLQLLAAVLCLAPALRGVAGYGLPTTPQTGHTGLRGSKATVVTVPGFAKLEGSVIPKFCQVPRIEQPRSKDEVVRLIKQYKSSCGGGKLQIRASKQLYTMSSDLLCPSYEGGASCTLLMDMERLDYLVSIDKKAMTAVVGPALTYNLLLNSLEREGLALDYRNLPFYSNLTMAGMLLTGSHGSSTAASTAFGHLVTSVTWVDALGSVHNSDDVKKLLGSLGLFGIIIEMTVKVAPLTKIESTARRVHDAVVAAKLQDILKEPGLTILQWRPDVYQATVMTRKPVPVSTPGRAEFQAFEAKPVISPAAGTALAVNQLDNAFLGNSHLLDDAVICAAASLLIPYYRDEQTKVPVPFGKAAVGRFSVMVGTDCIPGSDLSCLWRQLATNFVEVGFKISDLPAWMDDVRKVFRREVPTCTPSVIEFVMRFGRGSDAPLDMAYKQDTLYVDIVSNKGAALVDEPAAYQHVYDELEQLTLCKYGARPHWGKNSNRVFANPRCSAADVYPELPRIAAEARQYDPQGAFVSPLIDAMLKKQSQPKTPGCAVRNECYCDADVDCGSKHVCVPGGTFPEYKVCKAIALVQKDETRAAKAAADVREKYLTKAG